jgi:hypothetical protein
LAGSGLAQKKRKYFGSRLAQPFWADIGPLFFGFMPGPVIWAGSAHMFLIIYIYTFLLKKMKKIPKNFKNP